MKTTIIVVSIIGTAWGAPTKTIEDRQLGNLPSFGTGSGLGSIASLFPVPSGLPGLGDLGSLGGSGLSNLFGSGSSSGGFPSFSGLPNLGGSSGGLGGLGGLLGSGSSSSSFPSFSGLPSLSEGSTGSTSSSGGLSSLLSSFGGGATTKRAEIGSSTANGVTDKDACQPLTFIFARGTTELGNMGNVVGPVVAEKLKTLTNNKVVVQGVDYPASAEGNAAMGAEGGPKMAQLVEQALKQCANTKVVLGGYSQGAMVVHNAANRLSSGQVSGAVLFGDPFKSQAVANLDSSKVKEFCAQGDPVCLNGGNVMAHISYGGDAEEAAQFLVKAAGVSNN
ncbi:cutinase-domain-containing protein [Aspergillus ambiguus]|uniref:carbohydrate esterase family 5 protein n=1 Tax=Aspergillus ambiguus TaxID=176160 RepID=UPI003CCCE429